MKIFKIILIITLLFNAVSALFGGMSMIISPNGKLMKLDIDWLQYSPFENFLFPGMILFTVLGLGSLICVILILIKKKYGLLLSISEGFATIIWIVVQIIMIRETHYLHLIYGLVGLTILIFSFFLIRQQHQIEQ